MLSIQHRSHVTHVTNDLILLKSNVLDIQQFWSQLLVKSIQTISWYIQLLSLHEKQERKDKISILMTLSIVELLS